MKALECCAEVFQKMAVLGILKVIGRNQRDDKPTPEYALTDPRTWSAAARAWVEIPNDNNLARWISCYDEGRDVEEEMLQVMAEAGLLKITGHEPKDGRSVPSYEPVPPEQWPSQGKAFLGVNNEEDLEKWIGYFDELRIRREFDYDKFLEEMAGLGFLKVVGHVFSKGKLVPRYELTNPRNCPAEAQERMRQHRTQKR